MCLQSLDRPSMSGPVRSGAPIERADRRVCIVSGATNGLGRWDCCRHPPLPPPAALMAGRPPEADAVKLALAPCACREAARQLAASGAFHVVLACRNTAAAERVADDIRAAHAGASVEVGPPLDLACLQSVRSCATELRRRHRRIDVLINNAGERRWRHGQGGLQVGAAAQGWGKAPAACCRRPQAEVPHPIHRHD